MAVPSAQAPLALRRDVPILLTPESVIIGAQRVPAVAALVWNRADGRRSVSELAELLTRELQVEIQVDDVWSALDCLHDANLMASPAPPPGAATWLSRRTLLNAAAYGFLLLWAPLRAHGAGASGDGQDESRALDAPAVDELRDRERRALNAAHDARRRGDLEGAAASTEQAKEAARKRGELERRGEQDAKERRLDAVGRRRGEAPDSDARRTPSPEAPALGGEPPDTHRSEEIGAPRGVTPPAGLRDERRDLHQEQELKRTQERSEKRLPP